MDAYASAERPDVQHATAGAGIKGGAYLGWFGRNLDAAYFEIESSTGTVERTHTNELVHRHTEGQNKSTN
jgi:hypothetical protein